MFAKNIMKKRNWALIFGLGMIYSWSLFSQQSNGHTVTIRVVRPNVFSVKPSVSIHSLQIEKQTVQIEWQAGKRPKKITASIVPGSLPIVIEARETKERWALSPNYDREILFLQSPSLGNTEWLCKIKAVQSGSEETPNIILYTMAEM